MGNPEVNVGVGGKEYQIGTDAWSMADAFVKLKVFKPMYDLDRYQMIAYYGRETMQDVVFPEEIPMKRLEALNRYKDTLKMLMENVKFKIGKNDRKTFDNLRKHLLFIESILGGASFIEQNHINHTEIVSINEPFFRKCMTSLQKLKEDLNIIINNTGMIFRTNESTSFDELLKDIAEGG